MYKSMYYGYLFKKQNKASQLRHHREDFLSCGVFHEGVERLFVLWKVIIFNIWR